MERTQTTTPGYYARGSFSRAQKAQLLKPIKPERVMRANGNSHLSQQDVRAHLIRTFDFGGFDIEVLEIALVFEQQYDKTNAKGELKKGVWDVCYRSLIRLTLRNPDLAVVQILEDGATDTAEGQPSRGAAHGLAYRSAISLGIKRAATSLGDQFGLSLYNKGQVAPLVRNTIAQLEELAAEMTKNGTDDGSGVDLQEGIEQQVDLGLTSDASTGDYADDQTEPEPTPPSAKPVATKRATNGRQGAKRAPAAKDAPEALSEAPAAAEEAPKAEAPRVDLNRARAADALPGETEPEYQNRKRTEREAAEAIAAEEAKAAEELERQERAAAAAEAEAKAREAAEAEDVAERIKREREERGAPTRKLSPEEATERVKAEPEPWAEPAGTDPEPPASWAAMTPGQWQDYVPTLQTVEGVRKAWQGAEAAGRMVTELRMLLLKRKAKLEAPVPDPQDEGAQLVGAEG